MDISIKEVAAKSASGRTWPQLGAEYGCDGEMLRGRWRRWKSREPDAWENIKNENRPVKPIIEGVFPDDDQLDPVALWDQVITAQDKVEEIVKRREAQTITINDTRPVGIALLSDVHFGNPGTDYKQAKRDAEIIGETDGLYAAEHGDGIDNWIVGRLQAIQRAQVLGHQAERQLFFDWLDKMEGKLLWMLPGNHPWWSYKLAGIDVYREKMRGVKLLYDQHEIYLTLRVGSAEWRILSRHKWRYSSIFNPTHGIEVAWERRGLDFDIGIGGHTHTGTLFREFVKHSKKRLAVQIGTYKINGEYGRELGFADPYGRGCGMVIFFPDGEMHHCRNLEEGARYLGFLRESWRPVPCDSAA